MPYEYEYAHYQALQRLATNLSDEATLPRLKMRALADDITALIPLQLGEVQTKNLCPRQLVAVDGSILQLPLADQADYACIGYLSIAAVAVDWAHLQMLDAQRPINPYALQYVQHTDAFTAVLPGPLVVMDDDEHAVDSFRHALYCTLANATLPGAQESVLATYEALALARSFQPRRRQRCPFSTGRCGINRGCYRVAVGTTNCLCQHHRQLYSTDALRLHELFPIWGSCEGVYSETMRVYEQLWLFHYLRRYEHLQDWDALRDTIFVLDGPLAVFGSAGWLSRALRLEIQRITLAARTALGDPYFKLMLIGVEKTGKFVDYFAILDSTQALPQQSLWLLDDATIKRAVVGSSSQRSYGRNTYYGSKLLYKNLQGRRFVLTLPDVDVHDLPDIVPNNDARLGALTTFLDAAWSARYAHALHPLVIAHAEAALPKRVTAYVLGSRNAAHQALQVNEEGA